MPKKKALGRTSEPRHMPSTVAPISRRSPRLCCTYELKTQMSPCWERCSNQPNLREIPLDVTPLSFGRRIVFGAYRGRRSKGLFSKKNMERRGQLHGDKDQLTAVVSKAKSGKDFAKKQCWFQTTGAIFTHVKKMSRKQQSIFQVFFFDNFLLCFWSAR